MNSQSKKFEEVTLLNEQNMSQAKEYHITLIFYLDLPDNQIEILKEKFKSFSFSKFNLTGDKLFVFPNKNNPYLYALGFKDNSKLIELYKRINTITNIKTRDIFNPHITLLRKEKLPLDFKKSKEKYGDILPIELEIKSFGLYKSEPAKGMNSYTPIFIVKLK